MESWSKMNWGSRNSSQILGELGAITDAFAGKFDKEGDSSGFLWEEDSSSKFSGSSDSPLIDLKLGNVRNSEETMILSSSESVARSKKVRAVAVSNQTAYCQVYGCNKDLSSSKDYHKRHKVCEVHSKTSKVIVNGIEQRFCQQCSRFHLLGEFDEGKRSCRKRLAGHNERRRKPQFSSNLHQGRASRLLSPYSDGRLQGNAFLTPFICSDILHDNTLFRPIKYGRNDYYANSRSAEEANANNSNNYGLAPANSFQYQQLQPRLPFPYIFEKKPSFGTMFTGGPYQEQEGGGSNSSDLSIFNTTTAPAMIDGFSGISESGCALSLLSSQSQNSSSSHHVTEIPIGEPRYSIINQDKHNLVTVVSNGGTFLQGSDFNVKDRALPSSVEDGATIDLLQLSSKLQQVQQQRQENHTFF